MDETLAQSEDLLPPNQTLIARSVSLHASIPTQDPQAALQFCRWLQSVLSAGQDFTGQLENVQAKATPPDVSVVVPVFNEQENLPELYRRLRTVLDNLGLLYELVLVDDGSRDGSLELMKNLATSDGRVLVVELARNFGHQVAISAGLDHARGKGVIIMDADLQDPPEVLPEFIAKWSEGHDVVYAIRAARKENWLKRSAYASFYRLLSRIANIHIPLDAGDFCIMDRRVVDILVSMPERNRFVRGIRSWVGLDQIGLPYNRDRRFAGKPKFTFNRLVYLAIDGLVSFSFVPLRLISTLGLAASFFSIWLAVFYVIQKFTRGLDPPGFATTITAIFFLAGLQLTTLGVIGEYVGRIFEEVKRRPLYIIRRLHRSNGG
jgi:dolichol-phosphate mannosyltransferase